MEPVFRRGGPCRPPALGPLKKGGAATKGLSGHLSGRWLSIPPPLFARHLPFSKGRRFPLLSGRRENTGFAKARDVGGAVPYNVYRVLSVGADASAARQQRLILQAYHNAGVHRRRMIAKADGLPRQCAHWLAMTCAKHTFPAVCVILSEPAGRVEGSQTPMLVQRQQLEIPWLRL